ncbi:MAG: hypothetical protein IJW40_08935 [Clostridia bacterium]|nr:hypothetical protein [Clostridia bacterium]
MDKKLVGQWYKEEMGETLNIFDEMPLRMKMSFSSSGYYNFEPNCVYEQDGDLCFEINDEQNRMVYHVHLEGEALVGYYTRFGVQIPVHYARMSEVPVDEAFFYEPTEIYVPNSKMTRIQALRKFAAYDPDIQKEPHTDTYVLGGSLPDVLVRYDFYAAVKPDGTDATVFRTLNFVCDHFHHNGCIGLAKERTIEGLIAFCEAHDGATNCRGLALLLAALLRLCGIKARHITCMPYEEPFDDCHVVVDCLMPSGKRIMLDPTQRLYYKDEQGEYVSLQQLRRLLIDGEPIYPNADASYNGGAFDAEDNRNYMTKNTLRFSRGTYFKDGYDDRSVRRLALIPAGYPIELFPARERNEFIYDEAAFWSIDGEVIKG